MYFTNVQFLKELKQESDSKSKLKDLLILLTRILAIVFLVLAFAQPFLTSQIKRSVGEKVVSVYIDNSFSMESTNKNGTMLENAKNYAVEIVRTFKGSDKFQLLTNDFEGKHQRFLSKEEFVEQLEEIKISPSVKNINEVIKRQQNFLQSSNNKNRQLFLISDFQKNATEINKADVDTGFNASLIPVVSQNVGNVYIDSVWFDNPVQQYQSQQVIHALIVNRTDKGIDNATLKLYINDKQVSLNSFSVSAGSKQDVSISFTVKEKGINKGVLKIDDFPITYDDDFYFSFEARNIINVLVVNGRDCKTASNFRSLLQSDSLFVYTESNEQSINYSLFSKQDVIIVNNLNTITNGLAAELQKFTVNGGSIIVFPGLNLDAVSYNSAFATLQLPQIDGKDTSTTRARNINTEQGLYNGVFVNDKQSMDLPKVKSHYRFAGTTKSNSEVIIPLQNGTPFLSENVLGNGKIYLFAVSSEESSSNLLKHAIFVPTIIKIAILSLKAPPVYYLTSANTGLVLDEVMLFNDSPLHVVSAVNDTLYKSNVTDIIPEQRNINGKTNVFFQNQINRAGHYFIKVDTTVLKGVAFNYNRAESVMDFYTTDQLKQQISDKGVNNMQVIENNNNQISTILADVTEGKKLWKFCLILALIFLATEILIIRLFKK